MVKATVHEHQMTGTSKYTGAKELRGVEYARSARCEKHGKTVSTFIGVTEKGWAFRCPQSDTPGYGHTFIAEPPTV